MRTISLVVQFFSHWGDITVRVVHHGQTEELPPENSGLLAPGVPVDAGPHVAPLGGNCNPNSLAAHPVKKGCSPQIGHHKLFRYLLLTLHGVVVIALATTY